MSTIEQPPNARLGYLLSNQQVVYLAKQLRVDPSYVFRVGNGERNSGKIMQALEIEMKRLEKLKPK